VPIDALWELLLWVAVLVVLLAIVTELGVLARAARRAQVVTVAMATTVLALLVLLCASVRTGPGLTT